MCVLVRLLRQSRPSHKFRPHHRPPRHTSQEKSPTSSSRSSRDPMESFETTLDVLPSTIHCAVAPLSAATGCLPADAISSRMSKSGPMSNIPSSSPVQFTLNQGGPGFYRPVGSHCTLRVYQMPQASLSTNLVVNLQTWKSFVSMVWTLT